MMTENIKALVEYRLGQAEESLRASKVLIERDLLRPCVNRAYYAMFYSVLALLAIDKKETSRHSGVISLFDKHFVKQGIFKKDFSRWLHDAFDLRQRADYAPDYNVSSDEATEVVEQAEMFVQEMKKIILKRIAGTG
jgi:uncharacterized protein (UPF0332 family)